MYIFSILKAMCLVNSLPRHVLDVTANKRCAVCELGGSTDNIITATATNMSVHNTDNAAEIKR